MVVRNPYDMVATLAALKGTVTYKDTSGSTVWINRMNCTSMGINRVAGYYKFVRSGMKVGNVTVWNDDAVLEAIEEIRKHAEAGLVLVNQIRY